MSFVQLLFDFVREQCGLPQGADARRITKRKRVVKKRVGNRNRPDAVGVCPALSAQSHTMVKPPRGIDHDRPSQKRYDAVVTEMLAMYGLSVKRWRNSLSGVAVERTFRDGRVERTVESPYPTSPLRLAIFLHEVGHHAIGLGVHKPRCLEEFLAWRYAIDRMDAMGFPTKGSVTRRFERSMRYAVAKSTRRGIRRVPHELAEFV